MRVLVRRPIRDAKSVLSDSGGYASLHHRLISAAPPAKRLVGKLMAHAPCAVGLFLRDFVFISLLAARIHNGT